MDLNAANLFVKIYIDSLVFIFGLCIGSFLNVLALRLLSEESLMTRSKCPKCSEKIVWYTNIPVLSYIFLGGKCKNCKKRISIQYPLVELATAILFLAVFLRSGFSLQSAFLMILISSLVVITLTDIKEKVIFDITVTPLILFGLIYNFFDMGNSASGTTSIPLQGIGTTLTLNSVFISAIIGAIGGAAFFEIFSRMGLLLLGEYAFGGGDTLIAAALGAYFGWKGMIVILVLSFLFQLLIGVPVILNNMYKDNDYKSIVAMGILLLSVAVPYAGKLLGLTNDLTGALLTTFVSFGMAGYGIFVILKRTKERQNFTFLPFGPALVFGGIVVMFWGQKIINHYFM